MANDGYNQLINNSCITVVNHDYLRLAMVNNIRNDGENPNGLDTVNIWL